MEEGRRAKWRRAMGYGRNGDGGLEWRDHYKIPIEMQLKTDLISLGN